MILKTAQELLCLRPDHLVLRAELLGLLAGQEGLFAVLTGDASLRRRPMGRVVAPLRAMGARVDGREEGERAPGQVMVSTSLPSIEINSSSGGSATSTSGPHLIELAVTNTGDRPIQVGSHYRESNNFCYIVLNVMFAHFSCEDV